MRDGLAVAGALALAIVATALIAPLATLLVQAGAGAGGEGWAALLDPSLLRVLRFTVWQAALSTLLSVGLGILVARSLARRRFPGRDLVLALFALPLVVPAIVAVLGIVVVFGKRGWVNQALGVAGVEPVSIYGIAGILVAHVFFNLPLAVRLLLPAWAAIPERSWQLASQLGLVGWTLFRTLEWPVLAPLVARAAGVTFMLCFTSFAIPLALGGGPRSTTIEVAIYQALRFDADLGRVALLAVLQVVLCAALLTAGRRLLRETPQQAARTPLLPAPLDDTTNGRLRDGAVIAMGVLFVALPLTAVLARGLWGDWRVLASPAVHAAAFASLAVALSATATALVLGWTILAFARALRRDDETSTRADLAELPLLAILVVPPLAFGAGLFLLVLPLADPGRVALVAVTLVNALMGLPWVVATLGPAMRAKAREHDRLCAALGIQGLARLRRIDWPTLRGAAGTACGLVAAYSVGDLGVVALFGADEATTLPYLLYQRLGAYRTGEAAVLALVLIVACAALFLALERGIGGRAARR